MVVAGCIVFWVSVSLSLKWGQHYLYHRNLSNVSYVYHHCYVMVISDNISRVCVYFHHQRLELALEQEDRISEPEIVPQNLTHENMMSTPSACPLPGDRSPHGRWFLPKNCSWALANWGRVQVGPNNWDRMLPRNQLSGVIHKLRAAEVKRCRKWNRYVEIKRSWDAHTGCEAQCLRHQDHRAVYPYHLAQRSRDLGLTWLIPLFLIGFM